MLNQRLRARLARLSPGWRLTFGLLALVVALASCAAAPGAAGALGAALALLMLCAALVDWRYFILPDGLSAAAFALGLANAAVQAAQTGTPSDIGANLAMALARAGVAAGFFFALRVGYSRLRGREGIGLGDVKLAGVAGVWLDWPLIPVAVEIAALTALAAYALRQRARTRPLRAGARLAFGAFFAPAIWLAWLIGALLQIAPY